MDFVIIANAWSAGEKNPTSKHRIALELVRRGCCVLWIEGSGMRAPSLGSSSDRGRIARKIAAAMRGARLAVGEGPRTTDHRPPITDHRSPSPGGIWVLSPLLVPLPKFEVVRRFNGWLCASLARRWCRKLGFEEPVLINYVPVLAEAMRVWRAS